MATIQTMWQPRTSISGLLHTPAVLVISISQEVSLTLITVNFFVPIDTTAATKLTGGLPLVPREKWNPPLAGFPTGKVPLVVNRCYSHDIRQTFNLIIDFPAEIDSLSGLSYYVAFVDVLKNGVTPFQYPAGTAYVGPGEGNQIAGGVVPCKV